MVVDYIFQAKGYIAKENRLWSTLILPILPLILGSVGAVVAKQYPYPVEIVSASGRFTFGLVAGLLSGFAWRWIKAIIGSKMKTLETPAKPNPDGASAGIVDDTEIQK